MRNLHDAIAREQVTLLFQPIVKIANYRVAGVEALVRWDHPTLGRLGAKTLLATADAAGMAVQLGKQIRSMAMLEAMAWSPALSTLFLSLNATAAELGHPDFVEDLTTAMAQSGFPSHRLILEITEHETIADMGAMVLVLNQLQRIGVLVFIDDFGTGFSSLAWLAQLPISGIKLDRSLTQLMLGNKREKHVVEAVVTLAHTLNLSITAEGIEGQKDTAAAFTIGCHSLQGFAISPPVSSEGLSTFVAGWMK
jgi:EAL domain-containing protein (putative c-di-GMP-specific phosphodiesterase class I)